MTALHSIQFWPKSQDAAIQSATAREILRPTEGLRMTMSAHQPTLESRFDETQTKLLSYIISMGPERTRLKRVLWTAVWLLAFIGLAAAAHRILALEYPETFLRHSSPAAVTDIGFAQHRMLTFIHILPGMLFMVLGPLQLSRTIRNSHLTFHRWSGRVFLVCCAVIATSALIMSFRMTIGGASETSATVFFALLFAFCLAKAFIHIRRREVLLHREWMIRGFAIGLAVATVRPIVGAFFAARRLTPHEFFGAAFWLGFTINLIAAEAWINYTRSRRIPEQLGIVSEALTGTNMPTSARR